MTLPDAYLAPSFEPPYRVLVLAASTDGWYRASAAERESALEKLTALFSGLEAGGARLVGSFDDDLFVTGQPSSLPYSIYAMYDADELAPFTALVHGLRSQLGSMMRLEVRIGRPLFLLQN